jgi:hypothetical protein
MHPVITPEELAALLSGREPPTEAACDGRSPARRAAWTTARGIYRALYS